MRGLRRAAATPSARMRLSGIAGACSLGVPRFNPANTTTADTRAQRGRQPQRDASGRERVDAGVGQALRQSGRATAPVPPRPGPGRNPRARPAGRAMSSAAVSASTVPNMVPMAATPTEKNSAQPVSCGSVRAIGYNRNPAASHRKPKAYTERRPILSASAPNGATRHSASSSLAKLSAETVRPCRWAGKPEIHGEQVGLHVAHEGEQPDRDERRI